MFCIFKYLPTFPISHTVKKAPRGLRRVPTSDKGDVVGGLDADHGYQLHVDSEQNRC